MAAVSIKSTCQFDIFENQTYDSTVTRIKAPPTLTHQWHDSTQDSNMKLGEKNQDTFPN